MQLTDEQRAFLIKVAHGMRRAPMVVDHPDVWADLWRQRYFEHDGKGWVLTPKGIQALGLDNQEVS